MSEFVKSARPHPVPPAAGQFGLLSRAEELVLHNRTSDCPSMEQFEARFLTANDRGLSRRPA